MGIEERTVMYATVLSEQYKLYAGVKQILTKPPCVFAVGSLLLIQASNYSLGNHKFEDTKHSPDLSKEGIDLIERKCGCRASPI